MNPAAVIAIALCVTGCAPSPSQNMEAIAADVKERSDESRRAMEKSEQRHEAAIQGLFDVAREPLRKFKAEKPQTCKSENLKKASANSMAIATSGDRAKFDLRTSIEAGAVVLEVADAARLAACNDRARQLYDFVIEIFVGSGYAGIRQRAQIGIDDLRKRG